MTELDPGAKELIALVGGGDGPSDSERTRLRASVLAQVGTGGLGAKAGGAVASAALGAAGAGAAGAVVSAGAGAGAGAVAAGGSVAVFAAKMVAIGAVLTGVGASGYVAVSHHAKSASVASIAAKSTEPAPEKMVPIGATAARRGPAAAVAAPVVDPEPSASAVPELPPPDVAPVAADGPAEAPPPTPVARPHVSNTRSAPVVSESVPETLEEETQGLRQALSSLRANHPDVALTQLDGEDARFPRGALAEERAVARIEALCALGRTSEAATLGSRFLAQHPRSLQAARVRASCAAAPGGR